MIWTGPKMNFTDGNELKINSPLVEKMDKIIYWINTKYHKEFKKNSYYDPYNIEKARRRKIYRKKQ